MRKLIDVALDLARTFETLGLDYALGGALAQNLWGTVRTTVDADLLVSIPAIRYQEVADALNALGFVMESAGGAETAVDVARMVEQTRNRHLFTIFRDGLRAEVFVPFFSLQHEILRRAIPLRIGDERVRVTTPEDMVLLKLVFHREKDLSDIRAILWHQKDCLDLVYLHQWAPRILPPEVAGELDDLVKQYISKVPDPGDV